MRIVVLAALAASLVVPAFAGDAATAARLRDAALNDSTAWDVLTSLSYEVGPRPAGSPAAARARDWAVAKLKELGFSNIRVEPFAKPSWRRGAEDVEMTAPFPLKLAAVGLGGSKPTPKKGIAADVVVVNSLADLKAAQMGAFKGKIVLVDQPMKRGLGGYGEAVEARYAESEAAKRGAVAYLTRSISTGTGRAPHTGHTHYDDGAAKIPAAAIGVPDADLLAYLAARGVVRLRLKLASKEQPKTVAWNISGEILGSEKPDEVIVIGGHIDSWDPGLGSIDDAAGIAIATAAAKMIAALPQHPKRTIRVVLWGSEETGGAAKAYAAAHAAELARIVVASESDLGSDRILKLELPEGAAGKLEFASLADLMKPLGIAVSPEAAKDAGSDVEGLQKAGVPVFSFVQDSSRYFDYHHSADDTPAIVDQAQLNQNVAAWAVLVYLVADSDADFRGKH
jgi:Zn-dependent M28 family amino/carboxypeptidase